MARYARRVLQREFNALANAYARSKPAHCGHEANLFAAWAGIARRDRVLDVGCGPGTLARCMARHASRVFALDLSPKMLEAARRSPRIPSNLFFLSGNANRLPFQDESFHVVTCSYSFANFRKPVKTLQELARAVRCRGKIALIDVIAPEEPGKRAYLNRLESQRSHFYSRIPSYSQYLDFFQRAGVALQVCTFHRRRQRWREWLRLSPAVSSGAQARKLRHMILDSAEGDLAGLHPRRQGRDVFISYQTAWFLLRRR